MRFAADANVKQAVSSWLQIFETVFFALVHKTCCHGEQMLQSQWWLHGDLIGNSATQVSRIHRSLNKVLSARVVVTLLLKLFTFPFRKSLFFFAQKKGRIVTRREKSKETKKHCLLTT
jgi:hypothetical protein